MDFLADQVASNLSVYFSDDDYQTWSSALTTSLALDRPSIADLGEFTKRAFRFNHNANTAFRIRAVEMYLGLGVS